MLVLSCLCTIQQRQQKKKQCIQQQLLGALWQEVSRNAVDVQQVEAAAAAGVYRQQQQQQQVFTGSGRLHGSSARAGGNRAYAVAAAAAECENAACCHSLVATIVFKNVLGSVVLVWILQRIGMHFLAHT
jgi:hypothetical protein